MTLDDDRPGVGHQGDNDDHSLPDPLRKNSRSEPTIDPLDHQQDHDQHDDEPDTTVRPVMQLWRKTKAESKRESQERRARVLGHEDLAQRLTAPPLRLSNPARWNGWVPPRSLPEEACGHCGGSSGDHRCTGWKHLGRVNNSPIRRQLVDIASEAMAREAGTS